MMTVFGLFAVALVALALWPVFRAMRRGHGDGGTGDPRLAAYRARLEELERELADGVLAADQADAARLEIQREMLANVADAPASQAGDRRTGAGVMATIGAVTVVLAAAIYLRDGRPDLVGADPGRLQPADVAAMIGQLEAHLAANPGDRQGWEMLGRALMASGRYAEAVPAFEKLLAITGPEDAGALVRYADALAMAAGGKLGGKPTELLDRVLALEPDNRTALWLSGMAAVERGENAIAVERWNKLLPLLGDPETRSEVTRLIQQAGGTVDDAPAREEAAATALRVQVSVAPGLVAQVPANAVLFVSARASTGPAMPLAVVRRPAAGLPATVVLDDTLAMTPDLRLSAFAAVTITARVSASGQATRSPGDLIGELHEVPVAGNPAVDLVIDSVVP